MPHWHSRLTSVLIGLLYGAMLPMFPWKPILTAGFIAPFLWTGILYSALGVISPILNARIDWFWFVISQIAFGLVCGFVVNLQVKVRTPQFRALPFAVRAGLHGDPGELEKDEDNDNAVSRTHRTSVLRALVLSAACMAFAGCDRIPGRPGPGPEVVRPERGPRLSLLSINRTALPATAKTARTAQRSRSPILSTSRWPERDICST